MTPILPDPKVRAAAEAAIAWAIANPTKVTTNLARTAEGHATTTCDSKAECFCILGRAMHELGCDMGSTNRSLVKLFGTSVGDARDVFEGNDVGVAVGDPTRGARLLKQRLMIE